ncbi:MULTISPECIES: cytidine deaminase [unclassified Streptomyces]|uniref:cytidine deaminase n=1 Tax=unclassified Streptomyces TaxID=2593676 RepID=UPI0004C1D80B|nr:MULTISPECIES: cytidine deaminase [unclassified Streptomyces]
MTPGAEFDWEPLRAEAREAMTHAYAPYSGYPVGVAALVDDGRTVTGCNVENASYGIGLCAECGLVSQLQRTGGGRLTHFTCVDGTGALLVPCGRCRQLLYEFGGPDLLLDTPAGVLPLSEMLPQAFGPGHLTQ